MELTDESIEAVRREAKRLRAETRRHIRELQGQLAEAESRLRGFSTVVEACEAAWKGTALPCFAEAMLAARPPVSRHESGVTVAEAEALTAAGFTWGHGFWGLRCRKTNRGTSVHKAYVRSDARGNLSVSKHDGEWFSADTVEEAIAHATGQLISLPPLK